MSKCALVARAVQQLTHGKLTYSRAVDHINFSNGARVLSLPSTTDGANLRGYTAQCVAIDEAAYVHNLDQILQAIAPTLTRQKDSTLILASTPAGKNGRFYELYQNAMDDDSWFLQTTDIYQAKNDGLDVDVDSLRTLCPDEDVFAQEYLCQFSKSSGSWISPELIEQYEGLRDGEHFLGIDVGVKRDSTALTDLIRGKDGMLYLQNVYVLQKMDFEEQFKFIKDVWNRGNFVKGQIDAVGIGYGLAEKLQKELSRRIEPFSWNQKEKTKLHEEFKTTVLDHKFKVNAQWRELLVQDMSQVERYVDDNGTTTFRSRRTSLGHADISSSLLLAYALAKTRNAPFVPINVPFRSCF